MDFITIHHPDLPDQSAQVSRRAYERVYKDKGWLSEAPILPPDNTVTEYSAPVLDDLPAQEEDAPQSNEE